MEFVILKENEGQTIKEFLREKHISVENHLNYQ